MLLMHTSDWHLGHRLYGQNRLEEQERFLVWLTEVIAERQIEALLIAGDIFDTSTPGSRTLALYYQFLHRLGATSCRHVVIIAGNHDSPSLLEAPKELLRVLQIHVVGAVDISPDREVLLLRDQTGQPELIVGAVPFLRDRDIRTAAAGETAEEKGDKLRQGIREHYHQVCQAAEQLRSSLDQSLPLIVMGHLFTLGGTTVEGDGVRELYVGGLTRLDSDAFPDSIDYLALGHLHLAQRVGGADSRRYSGAPLPLSFHAADQQKSLLLLETRGRAVSAEEVRVPCFQRLVSLRGDLDDLLSGLARLKAEASPAWVELHYEGQEAIANLRQQLLAAGEDSALTILRIRNRRVYDHALRQSREGETLDDLSVSEVFERCLDSARCEGEQRHQLRTAFNEIVASLDQNRGQPEPAP